MNMAGLHKFKLISMQPWVPNDTSGCPSPAASHDSARLAWGVRRKNRHQHGPQGSLSRDHPVSFWLWHTMASWWMIIFHSSKYWTRCCGMLLFFISSTGGYGCDLADSSIAERDDVMMLPLKLKRQSSTPVRPKRGKAWENEGGVRAKHMKQGPQHEAFPFVALQSQMVQHCYPCAGPSQQLQLGRLYSAVLWQCSTSVVAIIWPLGAETSA